MDSLELSRFPDQRVYLVVESQGLFESAGRLLLKRRPLPVPAEAAEYERAFRHSAPDNIVLTVIPGQDRGINFAMACILFLQSCMREEAIARGIAFDMYALLCYWNGADSFLRVCSFHVLEDDFWRCRVFDEQLVCMRSSTLFLGLGCSEKVGVCRPVSAWHASACFVFLRSFAKSFRLVMAACRNCRKRQTCSWRPSWMRCTCCFRCIG